MSGRFDGSEPPDLDRPRPLDPAGSEPFGWDPQPEDYLRAVEQATGERCLQSVVPFGICIVRYDDSRWQRYGYAHGAGRGIVTTVDRQEVRDWLDRRDPELVAREEVDHLFERPSTIGREHRKRPITDGGTDLQSGSDSSKEPNASALERLRERPRIGPLPLDHADWEMVSTLAAPPITNDEIETEIEIVPRPIDYLYGDERRAVRRFIEENEQYVRACIGDPFNPLVTRWDPVLWSLLCEEWQLGGYEERREFRSEDLDGS